MPFATLACCVCLCLGLGLSTPGFVTAALADVASSTPAQVLALTPAPKPPRESPPTVAPASESAPTPSSGQSVPQRDDSDARYERARALLQNGDAVSADAEFAVLVSRDPDNTDWLLGRAQTVMALGRPHEALGLLERARRLAPGYEDVWRVELAALEKAGQSTRAEALADDAGKQFPLAEWPTSRRAALREQRLLTSGTRVSLGSSYEHLSDGKGEWRTLAIDINHPSSSVLHLLAGLHVEERFEQRDEQIAVGAVARFGEGWAAAATADYAPNATVLPQNSIQLEIGRPIAASLSLGLRARRARHETVDVDTLAATAEAGFANYRVAYSLTATRPSHLDESFGHALRFSRDYGIGSHVSLVLANGDEAETVAPDRVLVTRVHAIALTGIHWHSAAWGFAWEAGYHEQGDLYHRTKVRLGLEHRF